MNTDLFLILLAFAVTVKTEDCPLDKSSLPAIKLKNDLFCGYEKTIRPVSDHKDPIHLRIRLILKYYEYEMYTNSFTIDGWIIMAWEDEHLTWEPEKYESITQMQISSDELWVPDLSVFNKRVSFGSTTVANSGSCLLGSTGAIACVVPTRQSSICVGDLTAYPFDTQNCTIRFGSWVHNGEEINITLARPIVSTGDLVPNTDWALLEEKAARHPGKYKSSPNNTYPSINFSFKFRRLAGAHAASVILPALTLIVITLVSLWIPPDHSNRLSLCCVNLVCEFLYLQFVTFLIPLNGDKIPLILLFARDSLLLSAFTIVFTVILKNMVNSVKAAPGWMANTVSILTAYRAGQFILLEESSSKKITPAKDDNAAIDSSPTNKEWLTFAKILDRICFTIYLTVYLAMHVYTIFSIL